MHYQDDPSSQFLLLQLERHVRLAEGVDAVRRSLDERGIPNAVWFGGPGFLGRSAGSLTARSAATALLAVARDGGEATYVVAIDVETERSEGSDAFIVSSLPTVAEGLQRGPQQRRLIVVLGKGDGSEWFASVKTGSGILKSAVAAKQPKGDLASAIQKRESFDDPAWTEEVECLTAEDIHKLVARGEHLPARDRVRAAMEDVQQRFLGRDAAVEMMVACALARVNMVFLGPPGTAKSLLVRSFSNALGVRSRSEPIANEADLLREAQWGRVESKRPMFEYLLTRYTTPEEIFGGVDINLLVTGGVHGRNTTGMLPQAETAFLDEIFKANSAILNTLLSITNERLFYNMGRAFKVNLAFVVGASNETPAEEELGALFDRFPIRVPCLSVREDEIPNLLDKAHDFDCASVLHTGRKDSGPVACLNDLRLLSKVVQGGVYGGLEVFSADDGGRLFAEQFLGLVRKLRKDYSISDRTLIQMLRLSRALAVLENAPTLGAGHLRCWGYVAPRMKAAGDLLRAVASHLSSLNVDVSTLFDGV